MQTPSQTPLPGRGSPANIPIRFESTHAAPDPDPQPNLDPDQPKRHPLTQFLTDSTRTILARNNSPDIPFNVSINPYRGCEHGCIYCYARPTHEYLGMSAGLDFETKILVKHDAPALLRAELLKPSWQPETIAISGVTDCYQPAERKFQITRQLLQVMLDFRNPVALITKNHLITRDLDLLAPLAKLNLISVSLSVTTLRPELTRIMEPRTSTPKDRLAAISALAKAGVPVGVMAAPLIPGLTDHELPAILKAAASAGATHAGKVTLRLPFAVKTLFEDWLTQHMPDRKNKILNRIRSLRDGQLNDPNFGSRMRGQGPFADQFSALFHLTAQRAGLATSGPTLSTTHFHRPTQPGDQLDLFGQSAV